MVKAAHDLIDAVGEKVLEDLCSTVPSRRGFLQNCGWNVLHIAECDDQGFTDAKAVEVDRNADVLLPFVKLRPDGIAGMYTIAAVFLLVDRKCRGLIFKGNNSVKLALALAEAKEVKVLLQLCRTLWRKSPRTLPSLPGIAMLKAAMVPSRRSRNQLALDNHQWLTETMAPLPAATTPEPVRQLDDTTPLTQLDDTETNGPYQILQQANESHTPLPKRTRFYSKSPAPYQIPEFAMEGINGAADAISTGVLVTPRLQSDLPERRDAAKLNKLFDSPLVDMERKMPANFDKECEDVFMRIPDAALPQTESHGKSNYTIRDKSQRVIEVQLRAKTFYLKKSWGGVAWSKAMGSPSVSMMAYATISDAFDVVVEKLGGWELA